MGFFNDLFSSGATTGAIAGGAIGSVVPGVGTAIGAGIGGALGAGLDKASATEDLSKSQERIAREQIAFQKETREKALGFAMPSMDELRNLKQLEQTRERFLAFQQQSIQGAEKILASVDPAIAEAGNQLLQMMQGKEAPVLDPVRKSRQRERQQLESQLSERLGAGFRTSSAGIEALTRFDQATDELLAGAQQQTLGQFMNFALGGRGQAVQSAIGTTGTLADLSNSLLAGRGNIAGRQISAIQATPVDFSNLIQSVGGEARGDLVRAGTMENLFGEVGRQGLKERSFDRRLEKLQNSGISASPSFGDLLG